MSKATRETILGDKWNVAEPICEVLQEMHDILPAVSYDLMTKAQQTIMDAGVYLHYHHVPQAIAILEEVTQIECQEKALVAPIIEKLGALKNLPLTSVKEWDRMQRRDEAVTKHVIEQAKQIGAVRVEQATDWFDLIGMVKHGDPRLVIVLPAIAILAYVAAQIF